MTDTVMPPHPGLEGLTNIDELKHLCPAFSKGCPYAALEEVNSLAVSYGDVSRCPAFKEGCPFSTKSQEEIGALMAQIPKDHPTLNMSELPSCEEGIVLVKTLNRFLDKSQLETLFEIKQDEEEKEKAEPEYLEDPQLASAMREGTKVVHRAAETSVFTKRFLKGDINADEYGQYINSLYFVYKITEKRGLTNSIRYMEALLEEHKEHPVVKIIHFPQELNREESLKRDLEYFYGQERVSELIDPITMTPAVKAYVDAMKEACAVNPALLIAHSYSRYLGDLSGGQILAKRLKKHVFQLDESDSAWDTVDGLNFYHFDQLGNQSEFKNFYRERLNAAKVDQATRDLIVAEAVRSFELNIALFDEVQALSEAGLLASSLLQQKEEENDEEDEIFDLQESAIRVETMTTVTDRSIETIDLNDDEPKKPKSTHWTSVFSISLLAIAVGIAVYKRCTQSK
ncbi:heme oxygenase-domain-containing protein [Blakeslea trispora]|nr:heme oxygenase-domain-containing protein [Blakeslea trispora]